MGDKQIPYAVITTLSLPLCTNMFENNLSSNLDGFVWFMCLPKNLSVVYMYAHERNLILVFLHICKNCETALFNCLIMLIIFVRGIVMFISVCSIARIGC